MSNDTEDNSIEEIEPADDVETEEEGSAFTVVVAYDFSEQSDLALQEALVLAHQQPRSVVHVLGVLDKKQGLEHWGVSGDINLDVAESLQKAIKQRVVEEIDSIKPKDFYFFVHARIGHAREEIVQLAGEVEADLIVIGTHGRKGITRMIVGSVAESVTRNAQCPVLVMRPTVYDPAERPTVQPEPVDPNYKDTGLYTLDPMRFSYTKRHQVMPLRPSDWPLW